MASVASSQVRNLLRQVSQVSGRSGGRRNPQQLLNSQLNCRSITLQRSFSSKGTPELGANNPANLDPFGIEEIASATDSTLVQGFYKESAEVTKENLSYQVSTDRPSVSTNTSADTDRLQIYDGWIKNRERMDAQARFEDAGGDEAEQVRETPYGKIRLDSENIVEKQGQYEGEQPYWMKKQRMGRGSTEGASMGKDVMTAEDFLKRFKNESRSGSGSSADHEQDVHLQHQKEKPTVYQPIQPRRLVHRVSQADIDAQKFQHNILDESSSSSVIPKAYQFPDFNKMTSQEIWGMLKSKVSFQNEFILALNKPYGIPIHSPAVDCRHFIIQFLDRLADVGNCEKLYPLHRLDKETSGVLLFAKDPRVANVVLEKFAKRAIEKTYLAVVKLCPAIPEGTIKIPIGEGKVGGTEKYRMVLKPDLSRYEIKSKQGQCREAITNFSIIKSNEYAAFLKVIPETGVKHQIRLHLGLGLGCPIIGDQKYSHRDRMAPQRLHPHLLQMIKVKQSKVRLLPLHLHCNSIQFTLPEEFTKSAEPVYVHATVPHYFSHTLRAFGLSR